jgi:hypothetical protein
MGSGLVQLFCATASLHAEPSLPRSTRPSSTWWQQARPCCRPASPIRNRAEPVARCPPQCRRTVRASARRCRRASRPHSGWHRAQNHPSLGELTPLNPVDLHVCGGYALRHRLAGRVRLASRASRRLRATLVISFESFFNLCDDFGNEPHRQRISRFSLHRAEPFKFQLLLGSIVRCHGRSCLLTRESARCSAARRK